MLAKKPGDPPRSLCARIPQKADSLAGKLTQQITSLAAMSYSRVVAPRTSRTQRGRGRGSSSAAGGYQPRLVNRPTVDEGRPPFSDRDGEGELTGTGADNRPAGDSSAASLEPRSLQRYGS